jgi:addiction module RelE/StbE family toxin
VNIFWSDQSKKDLSAIHDYIGRDSPFYADQMVERIILRADRLIRFPSSGHPVHEYPEKPIKEIHEKPYRILYRIHRKNVEIVTIVHFRKRLIIKD